MPKVDDAGNALSDAPESANDDERGGKMKGDPALADATEDGGRPRTTDKLSPHPDAPGMLPGEKPSP
jgi:hypothetical protein